MDSLKEVQNLEKMARPENKMPFGLICKVVKGEMWQSHFPPVVAQEWLQPSKGFSVKGLIRTKQIRRRVKALQQCHLERPTNIPPTNYSLHIQLSYHLSTNCCMHPGQASQYDTRVSHEGDPFLLKWQAPYFGINLLEGGLCQCHWRLDQI